MLNSPNREAVHGKHVLFGSWNAGVRNELTASAPGRAVLALEATLSKSATFERINRIQQGINAYSPTGYSASHNRGPHSLKTGLQAAQIAQCAKLSGKHTILAAVAGFTHDLAHVVCSHSGETALHHAFSHPDLFESEALLKSGITYDHDINIFHTLLGHNYFAPEEDFSALLDNALAQFRFELPRANTTPSHLEALSSFHVALVLADNFEDLVLHPAYQEKLKAESARRNCHEGTLMAIHANIFKEVRMLNDLVKNWADRLAFLPDDLLRFEHFPKMFSARHLRHEASQLARVVTLANRSQVLAFLDHTKQSLNHQNTFNDESSGEALAGELLACRDLAMESNRNITGGLMEDLLGIELRSLLLGSKSISLEKLLQMTDCEVFSNFSEEAQMIFEKKWAFDLSYPRKFRWTCYESQLTDLPCRFEDLPLFIKKAAKSSESEIVRRLFFSGSAELQRGEMPVLLFASEQNSAKEITVHSTRDGKTCFRSRVVRFEPEKQVRTFTIAFPAAIEGTNTESNFNYEILTNKIFPFLEGILGIKIQSS